MTLVIRPSSLPTWADCGRRTAAKLFRPMVEEAGYELRDLPNHVGASVGTACHRGAALLIDGKLSSGGTLPPVDAAIDAAIDEFDQRLGGWGTVWDDTTNGRDTAQKQIARMTRSYHAEVAPKVNPVMVEQRLEAVVTDEPVEIILSGQADVLTCVPGGVRDLKTGIMRRANGAQYGAYNLLGRTHGHDVRTIHEDFVPRVSLKKPQPRAEEHEVDATAASQEANMLIGDIVRSVTEFRALAEHGDTPPHLAFRANPYSSLCGSKWCPAWGTRFCGAHKGED